MLFGAPEMEHPPEVHAELARLQAVAEAREDAAAAAEPEVRPYFEDCLLYTSPSPRDQRGSRMPSSA